MERNQINWPESVVPLHGAVAAFALTSTAGLEKSLEHLPASSPEHHDLGTFSDALRAAIKDAWDNQASNIRWIVVFEQFMDELDEQVEYIFGFDSERNSNYQLKDSLETLDSSGCLPIAFKLAAPWELQLGRQVELLEESKDEASRVIGLLLSHGFNSQATTDAANICYTSGQERDRQVRSWVKDGPTTCLV
jgi:hypothetical protein